MAGSSDDHNGEDWIRCCKCTKWAHTTCPDTRNARFVCERCQSKKIELLVSEKFCLSAGETDIPKLGIPF